MKKILISGSNGFVGSNFISKYGQLYNFSCLSRIDLENNNISINEEVVLHFAGLAHDTNKNVNPDKYFTVNTKLTEQIWNAFLHSEAKCFIYVSSIKAVRDNYAGILTESVETLPTTPYGKSKMLAENIILNSELPSNKRFYILRPSMIYGKGNKGNLNSLYKFVSFKLPWILTTFNNKRTLCSINNFNFVVNTLINNNDIESGVYNVCNSESISTNEIVLLIGQSLNRKIQFLKIPKSILLLFAKIGDLLKLPFNSENLTKLTEDYVISNEKILKAINSELPDSTKNSLLNTFKTF